MGMHRPSPSLRVYERLVKVRYYQTSSRSSITITSRMMLPKHLISFDCGGIHRNRAQHTLSAEPHLKTRSRRRRIVSTLMPALLTERDHVDLSGMKNARLSFPRTVDRGVKFFYERGQFFTPFPPHARGFFYFGPRPGLPPLAASIRFRCTPTAHPSSFDDGYDLLRTDGLPWQWLPVQAAMSASPVLR
ncbi:hypothetical protein DFH07DRAFT_880918, partial [Mycena maculata]